MLLCIVCGKVITNVVREKVRYGCCSACPPPDKRQQEEIRLRNDAIRNDNSRRKS